jgi:hypothetical protein
MKKVNYYGLELEVPEDTKVVAMDGNNGRDKPYEIFAYTKDDLTWREENYINNAPCKKWATDGTFTKVGVGCKGMVKPKKSKMEV